MNKKIAIALVVMLYMVDAAQAGTFWSARSGDWSTGSNWDVGIKPAAGDLAIVLNQTITVTGHEQAGQLSLGYVWNGTVNIAAGGNLTTVTMHVGQTAEGNLEVGTMNVYGQAYAEQLFVANERANGRGVLNVYGGGLMTVGTWACKIGNTGTQVGAGGTINLKGNSGMIVNSTGGIVMTANGHIDIEAGQLKVLGDWRTQLASYISSGRITGYSTGRVNAPVFEGGYTIVTAVLCDMENDFNQDCYINLADFAIFAENWLECSDPQSPQCESNNFTNLTIFLENWLKCSDTKNPECKSDNFAVFNEGYPFSFTYDGVKSRSLLSQWTKQVQTTSLDPNSTRIITTWVDPASGLKVTFEKITYSAFSAVDWLLYFENTGNANTGIISNVQVLDTSIYDPCYVLYRTNGGIPDANQFEVSILPITITTPRTLSTVNGTPSTKDLPFFRIDTGNSAIIIAIGWTGNWKTTLESPDDITLKLKASMGATNFYLYPGEKVRTPRILAMVWNGQKIESNSQFRQLIYKYYSPELSGQKLLPIATCNTGYTHMELGGFWDVETTAANQISMINAYGPLGIKYMVTDAGWMQDCLRNNEDLWTNGMGSWVPRTDHYPNGVKPVADAANAVGIKWGLWMTPEMANPGTIVYTQHPEWLAGGYYMVDFGKQAVIDYMYNIVDGFMKLSPGFRVYRTDGGFVPPIEPEGPNRTGINEMKYVMGLYEFWDRLAMNWPDSFRYGCDCGGQRIDLEMIKRFHVNQKSDYFSVNDVDQAAIWALSQYLPNNLIDVPLVRMDDYTVHSTFASSINLGWTADQPGFDLNKAQAVLAKYNSLAPRLIGAWYPLLPYSRAATVWMASQYHRPDLEQGIVLAFRHASSAVSTKILPLYGLTPTATYQVYFNSTGQTITRTGAQLMQGLSVTISTANKSDLIEYERITN